MADDDQQPQQRYWFPYWSGQPPPVRPHMPPRRPPAPVAPSSPQHHLPPSRGGASPPSPPSQAPRVSHPSPSRASPLAPIREPPPPPPHTSSSVAGAAKPLPRPVAPLATRRVEAAPKLKDVDVVVPKETKAHGKATHDQEHKAAIDKEEKAKVKEEKHHADKHKAMDGSSEKKKKKHGEQGKLHDEIKAGVADMVRKASGAGSSSLSSSVTLAGENKGASMKMADAGEPGKKWQHGHGLSDDVKAAAAGEGRRGRHGAARALVNSNVQVINNSLLLQSSCNGGNPGVHLKLSAESKSKDKQRHAGDVAASTTAPTAAAGVDRRLAGGGDGK